MTKWLRKHWIKIVSSIAFYPAIIALSFLILSWLMLQLDFSEQGKNFKSQLQWLSLKDASTARSIVSVVAGGVISLTVFSFSMVMIVLNQAASQMSNRVVTSMIENRFQQLVLGFYIGTIVYALFLLSTIRDINSGIYVPSISIYLLIILTVIDIFFFIYFLDYVTQTVKYETVIKRIERQTLEAMKSLFCPVSIVKPVENSNTFFTIRSNESGYFQNFNVSNLLQIATQHNITFRFLHTKGTYLISESDLLMVYGVTELPNETQKQILQNVDFFTGQPIAGNPEYGFRQLAEVAIKALSPGINDPATAVLSINALTNLFAYRLHNCLPSTIKNDEHRVCISLKITEFANLFEDCFYPIFDYGKTDRYVQQAFAHMIDQLMATDHHNVHFDLLSSFNKKLESARLLV